MECETCENYYFDEESGEGYCTLELDEDEYYRFLTRKSDKCPFWRSDDEYRIVRKQN